MERAILRSPGFVKRNEVETEMMDVMKNEMIQIFSAVRNPCLCFVMIRMDIFRETAVRKVTIINATVNRIPIPAILGIFSPQVAFPWAGGH